MAGILFSSFHYSFLMGLSKAACRNGTQLSIVVSWLSECGCTHKKSTKGTGIEVRCFCGLCRTDLIHGSRQAIKLGCSLVFKSTVQTSAE